MTWRFTTNHRGHSVAMSAVVASGPSWSAAMSHKVSPAATVTTRDFGCSSERAGCAPGDCDGRDPGSDEGSVVVNVPVAADGLVGATGRPEQPRVGRVVAVPSVVGTFGSGEPATVSLGASPAAGEPGSVAIPPVARSLAADPALVGAV